MKHSRGFPKDGMYAGTKSISDWSGETKEDVRLSTCERDRLRQVKKLRQLKRKVEKDFQRNCLSARQERSEECDLIQFLGVSRSTKSLRKKREGVLLEHEEFDASTNFSMNECTQHDSNGSDKKDNFKEQQADIQQLRKRIRRLEMQNLSRHRLATTGTERSKLITASKTNSTLVHSDCGNGTKIFALRRQRKRELESGFFAYLKAIIRDITERQRKKKNLIVLQIVARADLIAREQEIDNYKCKLFTKSEDAFGSECLFPKDSFLDRLFPSDTYQDVKRNGFWEGKLVKNSRASTSESKFWNENKSKTNIHSFSPWVKRRMKRYFFVSAIKSVQNSTADEVRNQPEASATPSAKCCSKTCHCGSAIKKVSVESIVWDHINCVCPKSNDKSRYCYLQLKFEKEGE
eukprot:CAMPEP_0178914898 /NCGR_PEP_ID=MMETSP0786-20121207/11700_1 /TAXON_ID=186022 /ORGANISM="Thalassionema frauenfeldii, Strain CCMP 1798" /LENGTH=404 /DNA_ID=CAMNT_0020587895 /DNA_START=305 /DNA_END=1519 /DNA_ORIENTATION=+